ncbi:MAG: class I SAM-dependent methyltransferase [Oscillospiraceae bacterium]|nr:class I SAM-dependent methyltransferase [Oscillospiraceae bacterium]
MGLYTSLAPVYDEFTGDVDYKKTADFYESVFKARSVSVKTVLDLACGTGSMTAELASRGYELIGTDMSAEMLAVAAEKLDSESFAIKPMLLCQPMEELDLYGTVDAAVCCLDGLNYVAPELLDEVFHRLMLFIRPGGVFIFDINTPEKLRGLDGQAFLDETDDAYCVWRAEYDAENKAVFYGMDIFRLGADGKWTRDFEEHIEYAHEPEMLKVRLEKAGFTDVAITGDLTGKPPEAGESRIYIAAMRH